MKRFFCLVLSLVLCTALWGCQMLQQPTEESADAAMAPDCTVYTAQGQAVNLSSLRGKPVVLNFWASWCPPCKAEMPDFQKAWERYGQDVHFVMVNLTDGQQETVESASEFLAGSGFTFPVYYDTSGMAAYVYQIQSIPTTVFIRSDGTIATGQVGMLSAEALEEGIGQILEIATPAGAGSQ